MKVAFDWQLHQDNGLFRIDINNKLIIYIHFQNEYNQINYLVRHWCDDVSKHKSYLGYDLQRVQSICNRFLVAKGYRLLSDSVKVMQ